MNKKDYGVNGRHTKLGKTIPMPQFVGMVTEKLYNMDKTLQEIQQDIEDTNSNVKENTVFRLQLKGGAKTIAIVGAIITLGVATAGAVFLL